VVGKEDPETYLRNEVLICLRVVKLQLDLKS
jgi:hypothetical protein